ncbi:MAG: endo-1,4-beta-xylanase, partial [Clostridia bacterium]|nr:endo-1,4-beta-xylanase [Clostridia bacterium]
MKKIRTIFKRVLAPILSVALMVGYLLPFASCGNSTLAKAYKKYFPIGVALDVDSATGEFFYDDEFVSEFASITAGNEMKWKYTENKKGEYTWELGDYVVGKAEELGMKVRGHVLVWRDSTPDYVVRDSRESDPAVAKAKVLDDIRSHVTATIQHFGDDPVYCWDVVNEAISDSNDPNEIYYPCPLYEGAGEDYIFESFIAARQANPNIKLYYNDYNLNQPVKRAKAIAMIKKMQERGIPIDGIG